MTEWGRSRHRPRADAPGESSSDSTAPVAGIRKTHMPALSHPARSSRGARPASRRHIYGAHLPCGGPGVAVGVGVAEGTAVGVAEGTAVGIGVGASTTTVPCMVGWIAQW